MSSILETLFPTVGSDSESQDSSGEEVFESQKEGESPDLRNTRRSARKRKKIGGYFPPKRSYKKSRGSSVTPEPEMGIGHTPKKGQREMS
jgi:hypothetical protein